MSTFELFLLVSSIISLSVAAFLFNENYKLYSDILLLLNQQINLIKNYIAINEELKTLKEKHNNSIK